MYCTKCGAKLSRDAKFCMNCGKPVSAIVSAKAVELKASPANAAVPTKVVEPTAAPLGRNDVSSSDASSNGSSLESAAFADEPEKSCEAGACGASSALQEDVSPKRPETLRGAVNATKHRSRRRVPMVVLVALAMALAAGTAYAAYRV